MSLPIVEMTLQLLDFNRERTLATLATIEKLPDPAKALGWRPGPGRAHIAWQITHLGITEELFATERLLGTAPAYAELVPRFRGAARPTTTSPRCRRFATFWHSAREHLRRPFRSLARPTLRRFRRPQRTRHHHRQGAAKSSPGTKPTPGAGAHHVEPAEGVGIAG